VQGDGPRKLTPVVLRRAVSIGPRRPLSCGTWGRDDPARWTRAAALGRPKPCPDLLGRAGRLLLGKHPGLARRTSLRGRMPLVPGGVRWRSRHGAAPRRGGVALLRESRSMTAPTSLSYDRRQPLTQTSGPSAFRTVPHGASGQIPIAIWNYMARLVKKDRRSWQGEISSLELLRACWPRAPPRIGRRTAGGPPGGLSPRAGGLYGDRSTAPVSWRRSWTSRQRSLTSIQTS